MKPKFRQPVYDSYDNFCGFHYWGFVKGDGFIGPILYMDWPSLQFTGLHDCEGNEIYDGDIIRDHWGNIHQVIWGPRIRADLKIKKSEAWPAVYLDCQYMQWQVIGNIYENPELLEDKS